MADLTSHTGDDNSEGPGRGSTSSTPRWAKLIGIIVGVLVLLFAVNMLVFGGGFGFDHRPPGIH